MSSLTRLVITSNGTAAGFKSVCDLSPGGKPAANNFLNYIAGITGGVLQGASLAFKVGAIQATGTVVIATTGPTNGQTCTICGVTFTAVTSGATGNQFNISATASTVATNLAAAINGSTDLTGVVTASASSATVTITAVVPGLMGNGLVIANVNLSNATFVDVGGVVAGTDGTAYSIDLS